MRVKRRLSIRNNLSVAPHRKMHFLCRRKHLHRTITLHFCAVSTLAEKRYSVLSGPRAMHDHGELAPRRPQRAGHEADFLVGLCLICPDIGSQSDRNLGTYFHDPTGRNPEIVRSVACSRRQRDEQPVLPKRHL